jgi:REP-associated tyrosine transposase
MPDHLHLLAVATSDISDLVAFAHAVKQRTSYHFRRTHDSSLWQQGYFEHVLRSNEATLAVAKYILENPVRADIVTEPRAYPFSGSFVLDDSQLDELWQVDAAAFEDDGTP